MQLAQRIFVIVIAICACQTYALTTTQTHEISQRLLSNDDSAIKTCVGDGLMIGQAVFFWKLAHKTDDQIAAKFMGYGSDPLYKMLSDAWPKLHDAGKIGQMRYQYCMDERKEPEPMTDAATTCFSVAQTISLLVAERTAMHDKEKARQDLMRMFGATLPANVLESYVDDAYAGPLDDNGRALQLKEFASCVSHMQSGAP
ncbi:MAG: hypothetical protein JO142_16310 [Burkholderiales bacterium]|nr:hypothetical protein [Burkholderiales bacterium]